MNDWNDASAMWTYRTAEIGGDRYESARRYLYARLSGLTAEEARAQETAAAGENT